MESLAVLKTVSHNGLAGSNPALSVMPRRLKLCDLPSPLRDRVAGLSASFQKPSKYRAKRCEVDGEKFDSQLEARRWVQLRTMERSWQIEALRRQVRYPLMVGAVKMGDYIADFVYLRDGVQVIEDAKGVLTPLGAWKLKHMAAQGNAVTLWPERKRKNPRMTPRAIDNKNANCRQ